jgi:hypothetical protein
MIHHVHPTNNQHILSLELDQLVQTNVPALINAGKNLKSSFTRSLGKCAKVGSVDPTPTKRPFVVTPPLIVLTITIPVLSNDTVLGNNATLSDDATNNDNISSTIYYAHHQEAHHHNTSSMLPSSATGHIDTRPVIMTPSSMLPSSATATSALPSTVTGM